MTENHITVIYEDGKDRSSIHFERSRAKALGKTRYFNGIPCKNGHLSERMTVNGRCVDCMKEYKNDPQNIKRELERIKERRKNNPEKYRKKDRISYLKIDKESRNKKLKAIRDSRPEHLKRKYLTPEQRKITRSVRAAIWRALRAKKDGKSWEKIVGYVLKDLMVHLERQFTRRMTWDNYGSYWHIDHIIPISDFDASSEIKQCWALSNLRPLEAKENIKKKDKRIFLI